MKTAVIFLKGIPGLDKPKAIGNFHFTELDELKKELTALQKGYCEPGDMITYENGTTVSRKTGKDIQFMAVHSDVDFYYVAYIGMRIKQTA